MPLTIATPPTFYDQPDAGYASNIPLTTTRMKRLNNNAKYGVVRNECIYMGFFKNGNVVPLPVSPVDGYTYSQAEVQYRARLTCSRPPAGGFTPGQKPWPGVASSGTGGGTVLYTYHNVDDASGLVNTIVSYFDGSKETVTSDGFCKVYATCQRADVSMQTGVPIGPTNHVPTAINPPIFIEPVDGLIQGIGNDFYLLICVSDSDPNYGGCVVSFSTDGGVTYTPLGDIEGNCVTGVLTADWPAHADPDTTNDLSVSTAESNNGLLAAVAVSDRDSFVTPIYVAGGVSPIPYELMTYSALTGSAGAYVLKATGGGTNELRRAVLGAPQAGQGCDHPLGSAINISGAADNGSGLVRLTVTSTSTLASYNQVKVAAVVATGGLDTYLNGKYWTILVVDGTHIDLIGSVFLGAYTSNGTIQAASRFAQLVTPGFGPGQFLMPIAQQLIGTQLHFKFTAFNSLGRGFQPASAVVDYTYTPSGIGSDTGLPFTPTVGLIPGTLSEGEPGNLLIGMGPVSGPSVNADSISAMNYSIGYADESVTDETGLAVSVNSSVTTIQTSVALGISNGQYIAVEQECMLVTAGAGTTTLTVVRGQKGSTAAAHGLVYVTALTIASFTQAWQPGGYLAAATLAGSFQVPPWYASFPLAAARIAFVDPTVTNDFGSVTGPSVSYLSTTDGITATHFGARTLYGASLVSSSAAVLTVANNVLPPMIAPTQSQKPWSVSATLATAPTGADVKVTININGSAWMTTFGFPFTLTIPAGNTVSNTVSGADLQSIPSGAVITVNLTQIGSTYPGDGLSVQLSL